MNPQTILAAATTPPDRNALIRTEIRRIKTQNTKLKERLNWPDVFGLLNRNRIGRWNVAEHTPVGIATYVKQFRPPSRKWPRTRAHALRTKKAAQYIAEHDVLLALKLNLKSGLTVACKLALLDSAMVE